MKLNSPERRTCRRCWRLFTPKVPWRNCELDVVEAGPRDHYKEFLDRRIAYRKTSDGLSAAMNHDITAEGREVTPIRTSTLDIGGIWVVHAQRQMKSAIRIEEFDAIESFGGLLARPREASGRPFRLRRGWDTTENEARRPVSVS